MSASNNITDTSNIISAFVSKKPVNKTYHFNADTGVLSKKANAGIYDAKIISVDVTKTESIVEILEEATEMSEAGFCLGRFQNAPPGEEVFHLVTKDILQKALGKDADIHGVHEYKGRKYAARLKEGIEQSVWLLLDADNPPGIPKKWAAMNIQQRMELWEPLIPGLSKCLRIELKASSARVRHQDDTIQVATHALVRVSDPELIDVLRSHIQVNMIDDLSFHFDKHSKSTGKKLAVENRSVFDLAVMYTGRLMIVAKPELDQSAIDAGYVVDAADVRIVNPNGGALDISWVKMPTAKKLKEYSKKTGSRTTLTKNGKSLSSVVRGKLKLGTKIKVKGVVKTLAEWLPSVSEKDGLRCETPFRASESEAGWIWKRADGSIGLYDHVGVTYPLMKLVTTSSIPFGNNIPTNYDCSADGVFNPDGDQITEQPIFVKAFSRTADGENWKIHLEWETVDGKIKNRAFPKSVLGGGNDGKDLVRALANSGLDISRGMGSQFIEYLAAFKTAPYQTSVNQTGWVGDAFVLPNEVINQPQGEQIILDDGVAASMGNVIVQRGSLQGWQDGMREVSPMVRFLVCAALSTPFVEKLKAESGGFHIHKDSSQGKTTGLQASASVFGIGGDPNQTSKPTMILTWDSTKNALIIRVSSRNGLAVYFDELGTCDPRVFADAVYMLFTGQSKGRGTVNGTLQEEQNWMITLFSSGEISSADFIRTAGKNVKAGQMVRLLDIDLAADGVGALFPDAAAADAMKELCITHCGHALPALLKAVPDLTVGWIDIDPVSIGKAPKSIAGRARKKFLVVLHAGYVASDAGIIPWSHMQVLEAVTIAFNAWHEAMPDLSDGAIGARELQKTLLKHESRFEISCASEFKTANRLGWYRDDMFHFSSTGFKEACNGSNPRAVRKELKRLGFLFVNSQVGFQATIKVNGHTMKTTAVKKEFLGFEF